MTASPSGLILQVESSWLAMTPSAKAIGLGCPEVGMFAFAQTSRCHGRPGRRFFLSWHVMANGASGTNRGLGTVCFEILA